MARQSSGYLVFALTVAVWGCADSSNKQAPDDSDTSAAPVQDGGSAVDGRAEDASQRSTSTRPPSTTTGTGTGDAATASHVDARVDTGAQAARDGGATTTATTDATVSTPSGDLWKPKPGTRWQWDLSGAVTKLDLDVDVYDIDGFGTDATTVEQLHAMGKKAICYLSVGTSEPDRPDAKDFPKEALGKFWAEWNETYIDIRSEAVRTIMKKRFDMCKTKGFDAIEPDNMDMFEGGMNDTGFPLTEADGVAYAKWLADEAHARNMSIGQKNASSITSEIEGVYDWALTEDCFADGWCDDMKSYADDGKAMFMCEYTDTKVDFTAACAAASKSMFSAILKKRDLDDWIQFCQ